MKAKANSTYDDWLRSRVCHRASCRLSSRAPLRPISPSRRLLAPCPMPGPSRSDASCGTFRTTALSAHKHSGSLRADVEKAFREHAANLNFDAAVSGTRVVALDGKALKGSFDSFNDAKAKQLL